MRFSTSGFFHESVSPRPPSIPLEPFWIFSKICRDIRELMLTTPVINYRRKICRRCRCHRRLIFVTDFQWSPVSLIPVNNLSPVTTTPAINLLPVTRTRTPWRWGAAKHRRKLKGINQRYLRLLKSATAANGVIGTAMKSCIHKHPTHLDQRPLRPPKLNNAVLVWGSFGGLRGLWSGYVRCLCAFS